MYILIYTYELKASATVISKKNNQINIFILFTLPCFAKMLMVEQKVRPTELSYLGF